MYCTRLDVLKITKLTRSDFQIDTDGEFDNLVDDCIANAESLIDGFTLVPEGYFDNGGYTVTDELVDYQEPAALKYFPVISVSKVEIDQAVLGYNPDWIELVAPDYYLRKTTGLMTLPYVMPAHEEESIKVSYVAGYTTTPKPIATVTANLASNILSQAHKRKIQDYIKLDDYTVRVVSPDAFTDELKAQLKPYKRRLTY